MGGGRDAETVKLAGSTRDATPWTPEGETTALDRGQLVGRYVIIDQLGEGGMGTVFAAYDPELDRKVALKLLRADRAVSARAENTARLLAEARALAKLSHPNVVSIFDVQTFEDQIVLAMELVDGETVDAWLRREPRSPRQIVDVFIDAGRGLAGAHAAEFVHRDFKPSNVIIARDAPHTVRVLDFGLAQAATTMTDPIRGDSLHAPTGRQSTTDSQSGSESHRLTQTGFAVGTPRYMSPEQRRGHRVDARSDQFSFCVALWEALYEEPPHAGSDPKEIARAAARGELRRPSRRGIPASVVAVLRRGLRPDPDDRFRSMTALLAALSRDSVRARRRVAFASVGGVLVLGAGVGLGRIESPGQAPCEQAADAWAGAWTPQAEQRISEAFSAADTPYAQQALDRVVDRLDGYQETWLAGHRSACEATHVRREQSETMLDRRMTCLRRGRDATAALVALLESADASVVDNAVTAVEDLPRVAQCERVDPTRTDPTAVDDPELRAQVQPIRVQLTDVEAMLAAGRYDDAQTLVDSLEAPARDTGHAPLIAAVLFAAGRASLHTEDFEAAEARLSEAEYTARGCGHDSLSPRIMAELVYLLGHKLERADDAIAWGQHGLAASTRLPDGDGPRGVVLSKLGTAYEAAGDFDEARASHTKAIELLRATYGEQSPKVARALNNLGNVATLVGDVDAAKAHYEESAALFGRALGDEHPDAVIPLANLATIRMRNGRLEEGRDMAKHVLAVWTRAHGPEHSRLTIPLGALAMVSRDLDDYDAALDYGRRAVAIAEAAYGSEHPTTGAYLYGVGMTHYFRGDFAEAMPLFARSLAIREAAHGDEHPQLVLPLCKLALTALELPDEGDALPWVDRALRIAEKAYDADSPQIARVTYTKATVEMALEHYERAIPLLERTLALRPGPTTYHPDEIGGPRFDLAQAHHALGHDPAKVQRLASEAAKLYEDWGDGEGARGIREWAADAAGE